MSSPSIHPIGWQTAASVDAALEAIPDLNDDQIADLVAFLESLTDPSARDLTHLIPQRVPSGLSVEQ